MQQSSYTFRCTIVTADPDDPLVLDLPIELTYLLSAPYTVGTSSDLSFSASVTFNEVASLALLDALALVDPPVTVIDINSMQITTSLEGANPSMLEASLMKGVNDLDLALDTDDNGVPGPHRIELDPVVTATSAVEGATEVELGLDRLDQLSFVLGDFQMPNDCISPALDGFTTRYSVEPSE